MPELLGEGRSADLVPAGATAEPHPSRPPFGWAEKRARPERDNDAMHRSRRAATAASEDRAPPGSALPM